jgi:NADH-quinone oxidoreductase subunit G
MADVTLTVDGRRLAVPAGTLLIDACRKNGIEIPAFCYYPGLSLQAACRMCVVRIEKMPKLATACTTTVSEGMIVTTESPEIAQARKATIELLLGNHPLDCPVCDAGGECELQDMTFKYGAGESRYIDVKNHREEQKWSPVVYFDRPRCILCYRCVRMCGEGMDVWALGIQNRGSAAVIAPNGQDHLDCEQCGACIDVCPVGALTSDTYRYKTRPWEMNHVATVCEHCGDGCKTTLGVRRDNEGAVIVRGDNRDKSGINGDFLCTKGRFGFDAANSELRLTKPLIRNTEGELKPATWEAAIDAVAKKLKEVRDSKGGNAIGVIGSTHATNEENYLLQKFARTVLQTNNIDHHRTADYVSLTRALGGTTGKTAGLADAATMQAVLLIGGDPTNEHPALAWQLRTNVRINRGRLYIANHRNIKLRRQAKLSITLPENGYPSLTRYLGGEDAALAGVVGAAEFREALRDEKDLLIVFGAEYRGQGLEALVKLGLSHEGVKFALLGDYANSRGASDMGLYPDLLPGYQPVAEPGLDALAMFDAAGRGELAALFVSGEDPVALFGVDHTALKNTFVVVQDEFLTATAEIADVVLPTADFYEKAGTVTNTYGDLQQVRKAGDKAGVRTDFELIVRIADRMGAEVGKLVSFSKTAGKADLGQSRGVQAGEADRHAVWLESKGTELKVSPLNPAAIFDEIAKAVPGYGKGQLNLRMGNAVHTENSLVQIESKPRKELLLPAQETLFSSGTLGEYSEKLSELRSLVDRKTAAAD